MRDYMDRRVTPPKRVTSPTWGPPPPCKQALSCSSWLAEFCGYVGNMQNRRQSTSTWTLEVDTVIRCGSGSLISTVVKRGFRNFAMMSNNKNTSSRSEKVSMWTNSSPSRVIHRNNCMKNCCCCCRYCWFWNSVLFLVFSEEASLR